MSGHEPLRLTRPEDTKIVGLVFYGRRDRSSILDCYVRNNLRVNGGWLDEVAWGVNTENKDDLAYLELLLARTPEYRKVELRQKSYVGLWAESIELGNIEGSKTSIEMKVLLFDITGLTIT